MSEYDSSPSDQPEQAGFESTAGTLLREARQAQGVHLSVLAASLKVPVEKLEALEQDRFDLLLDAVFVRALASGVCRLLKLDPNPILQRLPSPDATRVMSQNRGINESFRSGSGSGLSLPTQLSKPVVLIGIALLLAAVVLVFLPVIQQKTTGKLAGQEVSSKKSASEAGLNSEPLMVQESAQNSVPTSSSAAESRLSAVEIVPSPSVLAASASVAATPPPLSIASESLASVAPASLATFSATQSSWVKVNDAKGVLVLNRTLQAGESVSVSGALPLRAVVGRADAVQVQVRGHALDLTAIAKNNVARFEVK